MSGTAPAAVSAQQSDRLRGTVVRGALINLTFAVVGGSLTFLQFLLVVRWVGPAEIGLYALASAFATALESISDFGIGDRLIQRDDDRLQESYAVAATAHLLLAAVLWVMVILAAPWIAHFYHQPRLWALLSVMSYEAFFGLGRLPLSLLAREFKYLQQRSLMFAGRLAGFIVTVIMGIAGYGIWSLVIGAMVALLTTSVPAWMLAGIRPKWKLDRQELRSLLHFSGPLWIGRIAMIGVQQGTILVLFLFLSAAEVGQYKAAEQIVFFIVSIDVILGQTIFPALCKLKDSPVRVGAGFTQASRVSMLWIPGIGMGMVCFAHALVQYVLTAKWEGAELFVQAQGIALIIGGVGYSWGLLFETNGNTRPIVRVILVLGGAFLFLFSPLTWIFGKVGAAAGIIAVCLAGYAARQYYINRLEMDVSLFEIVRRALVAALAAAFTVCAIRWLLHPGAGLKAMVVQLLVYGTIYAAVLAWSERKLFMTVLRILRSRAEMMQTASSGA